MTPRRRIAVLASGGGRSLENLCEQIQAKRLAAEIGLVLVDKDSAGALTRAQRWNLASTSVPKAKGESPPAGLAA